MTSDGVSIIICCYNSAFRLNQTLEHVWRQQPLHDGQPIELILVDNCCTDNTVQTVQTSYMTAHDCPVNLKVIEERRPGLTNARVAGITAARYTTLIFCDDDNWLAPDYSHNAHQLLADHPDVGVLGGCSQGVFESDPPSWFQSVCGAWAIGENSFSGYLTMPDATLRGAGLVLRKRAFEELSDTGFEFMTLDRTGNNLTSGGDSELCFAVSYIGYRQYFDSSLTLKHWIPSSRMTWQYALRLWQGFGSASILAEPVRIQQMAAQRFRNRMRTSFLYQIVKIAIGVAKIFRSHPWFHADGAPDPLRFSSMIGRLAVVWNMGFSYRRIILQRVEWLNCRQQGTRTSKCKS